MTFNFINRKDLKYYEIKEIMIKHAEEELYIKFPKELMNFIMKLMLKTKTKVSSCYRSMNNAIKSTFIRSYILSVRASGKNIIEQLYKAVEDCCYSLVTEINK